jgi:plastocyanin
VTPLRRAALGWALAGWAAAQAATVQVTVLAANGQPLADAVVVLAPQAAASPVRAPAPVLATVQQQKMRFMPALIVVPAQSRVRFTNLDDYEHHVRGRPAGGGALDAPAGAGFELRLAAASQGRGGGSQEVVMAQAGPIELGCHLHSVMRGHIYVADTPWVAKTDANGNATLGEVPEGAAQLRVWHGDQLLPTPPLAVNVAATTVLSLPTQVVPRGSSRRR